MQKPAEPPAAPVAPSPGTDLQVPQTMSLDSAPPADRQDALPVNQDPQPDQPPAQPINPREAKMAEIFANRATAIQNELQLGKEIAAEGLQEPVSAEPDAPPKGAEPQGDAPPVDAAPQSGGDGQEPPAAAPAPKIPLRVNGQQLELTQEELIAMAQRGIGADERFREAARMRDEAQRLHAQPIPQNTQPQPVAGHPAPQAPQPEAVVLDQAAARDLARRMNYGSEEDQVQAIQDLGGIIAKQLQGRASQAPSPDQLVQSASLRALETIRFENNLATVMNEFSDVFSHRALTIAAADEVNQLRFKYQTIGAPKSDLDLYREACTKIRDNYLPKAPSADAPPQPQPNPNPPVQSAPNVINMNDRIERKRAAPKPPVAATRTAQDTAQTERYMPQNIVANMRKSRGQPA